MHPVILSAIGVGGATVFGSVIGLFFRKISHKWNDGILGFAAGIMLSASVFGLILPAIEQSGPSSVWLPAVGILAGAIFLNLADKLTPHLHTLTGKDQEEHINNHALNKVLLFVFAIAIHNFPEGLAAGVSFGGGDLGNAFSVSLGIALQNIPEGLIIISPLLLNGVSKKRTFLLAASTGLIEVAGTFIGFFAASLSSQILPFLLAFAGGTMLYVISDEMIPETHSHGNERLATYSLLIGFILMMVLDSLL